MRDLHGLCNRLAEVFNEDDTPDKLSTEAREAIEELWEGREVAKSTIDRLERELDGLRVKVEAARKILEPMADCDPDIREWLGLPRFGDALRSPVTTGGEDE